jgi:D-sedoheptulose 7-phosphate isomerase
MRKIIKAIQDCFEKGNSVWVIGNGGSSAEASHLSEEFISLGYPVIALNDPQVITALSNDFGFENVFERYLQAVYNSGDLLITLSTSYKSRNILNAIYFANLNKIDVIKLPNIGKTTEEIQNNHLILIHKLYKKFKK